MKRNNLLPFFLSVIIIFFFDAMITLREICQYTQIKQIFLINIHTESLFLNNIIHQSIQNCLQTLINKYI